MNCGVRADRGFELSFITGPQQRPRRACEPSASQGAWWTFLALDPEIQQRLIQGLHCWSRCAAKRGPKLSLVSMMSPLLLAAFLAEREAGMEPCSC
jgi:hypothetical protein